MSSGTKRESDNAGDVKICSACLLANGKPCSPCADFLDLEAKIAQTETLLKNLISQQDDLRVNINTSHEPMIHQLPRELATQILEFCLPPTWFASSELLGPKSRRPEMYAPLYIAGVCRTWREIAMANPRWWKVVPVFFSDDDESECLKRMLENVEEWIRRAGDNCPLSFHVWANKDLYWPLSTSKRTKMLSNILALINRHSRRWQNLHIDFPEASDQKVVLGMICGTNDGAPILQNLRLTPFPFEEPSVGLYRGNFMLKGPKPAPSLVHISNLKRVDIQWHNATTVEWYHFGFKECLVMFRVATALVNCLLGFPIIKRGAGEDADLDGESPVVCHSLRSLTIRDSDKRATERLWDLLIVPRLETLEVTSQGSNSMPLQNVLNMLHRSSSFHRLTSLCLRYTYSKPENEEQLLSLLTHATQLTQLHIWVTQPPRGTNMYPDVNTICHFLLTGRRKSPSAHGSTSSDALRVPDDIVHQQIVLPKLTRLTMLNVHAKYGPTIDWNVITNLFTSRTTDFNFPTTDTNPTSRHTPSTNHHYERPLTYVRISFSYPSSSTDPSWSEVMSRGPFYIDKESTQRFLDIKANRGKPTFIFQVPNHEDPKEKTLLDLLGASMSHHGIARQM